MIIDRKVIFILLFLVTSFFLGCSFIAQLKYYLVIDNRLGNEREVKITLDNKQNISILAKYGKGISFILDGRRVELELKLISKQKGAGFEYDKENGFFTIIDGEKRIEIDIPRIEVSKGDEKKVYLPSEFDWPHKERSSVLKITFSPQYMLPQSFQLIIEERETKRVLFNLNFHAKWEEYQEYIKRYEYCQYYPQNDLQVLLVDGEKINVILNYARGSLKYNLFGRGIIISVSFPDNVKEKLKILYDKAYIQDESNNLHEVTYSENSKYAPLYLFFSETYEPLKEFSLFMPYVLKESSEESVIEFDFKLNEEEFTELQEVIKDEYQKEIREKPKVVIDPSKKFRIEGSMLVGGGIEKIDLGKDTSGNDISISGGGGFGGAIAVGYGLFSKLDIDLMTGYQSSPFIHHDSDKDERDDADGSFSRISLLTTLKYKIPMPVQNKMQGQIKVGGGIGYYIPVQLDINTSQIPGGTHDIVKYNSTIGYHITTELEGFIVSSFSTILGIKYYNVTYDANSATIDGVSVPVVLLDDKARKLNGSGFDIILAIAGHF